MHTNQRLLVAELARRGASIRAIDLSIELIEATCQGRRELILDRAGSSVSHVACAVAADKYLSKRILRERGISTPAGALFEPDQIDQAIAYGSTLGFPLVVKPNVGSGGFGVRSGIHNPDQLDHAICSMLLLTGRRAPFLVESFVPGSEYRIFITRLGAHAALLREPARVLGDGHSSIAELAHAESERRSEVKARHGSALCPIALDQTALDYLAEQGMDLNSIPPADTTVALRLSSNLSQGGSSRDMTDEAHPSVIAIAKQTLAAFHGLPCLGIDFITGSIHEPVSDTNPYAIIEVNSNPGLAMHHMPALGASRDAARMLAEAAFGHLLGASSKTDSNLDWI
jgi:cyanophycin synthetase